MRDWLRERLRRVGRWLFGPDVRWVRLSKGDYAFGVQGHRSRSYTKHNIHLGKWTLYWERRR